MRKIKVFPLLLLSLVIWQYACIKGDDTAPVQKPDDRSLQLILQNNFSFSMYYQAMRKCGMDTLAASTQNTYTLLVPDNDAFTAAGITIDSLNRMSQTALKQLVGYHILPGRMTAADIPEAIDVPQRTLAGPVLYTSVPIPGQYQQQRPTPERPIIHINGRNVGRANIMASNGVIHSIDRLLDYPANTVKEILEKRPEFSRFAKAMKKFGQLDALTGKGPFVVLAIPNQVFDNYGIDDAMLETMDTLTYRKLLFNSYVAAPRLFFVTDFIDAPVGVSNGVNAPVFILSDAILWYEYSYFKVVPIFYDRLRRDGLEYAYGDNAVFTSGDHLSLNGVVHGISALMVSPDTARIK